MKKLVFSIALMASLLVGAAADTDSYLYWMVNVKEDGWEYPYSVKVFGTAEDPTKSSYLNLYLGNGADNGESIGSVYLQNYEGSDFGFYAKLASDVTYKSYIFELWSDTERVGSQTYPIESYTDVQAYITGSGTKPPALGPLTMNMTLPAPEPSSGLLLLLGVAGLALRRRKQVAA